MCCIRALCIALRLAACYNERSVLLRAAKSMDFLGIKAKRVLSTLAGTLLLSSCVPVTDALFDCIDNDGPVLSPRAIPNPVLNQSYDQRITASVKNEPNDDAFFYDIVVSRTLPEGLIADVFERQVRITGAATELGTFDIDISVAVEDPSFIGINGGFNNNSNFNNTNGSGLCFVQTQRLYRITVLQGS